MTESPTELTFTHFLRAGILLTTLIIVPATAVCWNMVPKEFWEHNHNNNQPEMASLSKSPEPPENSYSNLDNNSKSHESISIVDSALEPTQQPLTESSTKLPATFPPFFESPPQEKVHHQDIAIKTMGGINDKTSEQPIPNSFHNKSSIAFAAEPSEQRQFEQIQPAQRSPQPTLAEPTPKQNLFANQQTTKITPQRNFLVLENQLKQLGAKYYRLEKWGSRGELFRFSCYVSPSESHQYQKYFQAIDSDELRVMESVIEEIKLWKQ